MTDIEIDDMLGGTEEVAGWTLRIGDEGVITQATDAMGRSFRLGQRLTANGRFGAPRGSVGVLVQIHRPFYDGRTSDILKVLFENPVALVVNMKIKDLEL
ncbi:MAG TPA: hypothetical protein VD862_01625 [Candidatus Paceibacterota bacterium]|nr:hypothetical protein [Candidatus Paceibacterota bacterium]